MRWCVTPLPPGTGATPSARSSGTSANVRPVPCVPAAGSELSQDGGFVRVDHAPSGAELEPALLESRPRRLVGCDIGSGSSTIAPEDRDASRSVIWAPRSFIAAADAFLGAQIRDVVENSAQSGHGQGKGWPKRVVGSLKRDVLRAICVTDRRAAEAPTP
jgi:hypothetical protein